jgi:hypothetical protein
MESIILTHKDLLELKFWLTCDIEGECKKTTEYLNLFELTNSVQVPWVESTRRLWKASLHNPFKTSILEVGTGPCWGVLPYLKADRIVGVDPLYRAYEALGILEDRGEIQYYSEAFDRWDTNDKFSAIFCANALDHGEMGFHLLPKFARLLYPGGHLFIHVQLRRLDQLNLIHDHVLTIDQLDRNLGFTDLVEVKRTILEKDFDAPYCPALVGIWRKP